MIGVLRGTTVATSVDKIGREEEQLVNSRTELRYLWGKDHPAWLGDQAKYMALHDRLRRRRGDAVSCVWGCKAKKYEWANLTGDYHDVEDFAPMCTGCHTRFDQTVRTMAEDFQGRKISHARLTEGVVKSARLRRSAGETISGLAREFGVHPASMGEAIRGKTWQWVT
jgi:hypothetical protein